MTVREALLKAYSSEIEIPNSVFIEYLAESESLPVKSFTFLRRFREPEGYNFYGLYPNISDRPASAFRGFFGDAYDQVIDEAGL